MNILPYAAALFFLWASSAQALDQARLETLLQTPIKSISNSPVSGIFEVVTADNRVVYVDRSGRYLFVGNLLDMEARLNLTQERMDEISTVDFSSLPLSDAIVEGNGPVRIAVFDDPDCPFCRKLHGELKQLRDVTLYYFVFNLPSHPEAYDKARKIVCSPKSVEALDRAMSGDSLDDLKVCDSAKVDRIKALADRVGIRGTPYLVPESGKPIRGFKKASELQLMVDEILLKRVAREATEPFSVQPEDAAAEGKPADKPTEGKTPEAKSAGEKPPVSQ